MSATGSSAGELSAGSILDVVSFEVEAAARVADLVHVEHLLAYSVRFASPLSIGETLELGGTVEAIDSIATLSLHAKATDRVAISGGAQVRISLPH